MILSSLSLSFSPFAHCVLTLSAVAVTLLCEYQMAKAEARGADPSRGLWWVAGIGKTLASLGFLSLYYHSSAQPSDVHSVHPLWLGAALIASAIGDVALIGKRDLHFLIGLGSFLLGHLAFMVAFALPSPHLNHPSPLTELSFWGVSGVALLISGAASAVAYRAFKPSIPQALRGPSLLYASVIALMVATAAAHAYQERCSYVAIGAVAFWLSDLAVARQRFQSDQLPLGGFTVRLWGLPLYYIAQLILAAEPSRTLF